MRNLTNTPNCETTVYINTNLSATEPLEVSQTSFNNPITLSLKGISTMFLPASAISEVRRGPFVEMGSLAICTKPLSRAWVRISLASWRSSSRPNPRRTTKAAAPLSDRQTSLGASQSSPRCSALWRQ